MVITRQRIRKELIYLLGFTVAAVIQTYLTCTGCTTLRSYLVVTLFSFIIWLLLWRGNDLVTHYINEKISWFRFPVRRLIVGAIATISYTIAAVVAAMTVFERLFDITFGTFAWTIYFAVGITIFISLFLHSREFFLRGRRATEEAKNLQRESIIARYETLKNQVSPHFLFNSLNALTNLVYEDQDKAVKFIKQLSEVYRYVLDSREKEVVDIMEEAGFLSAYLFLQQIRFGEKLILNVNLSGARGYVAPLVLQMLVENAIKHNIIAEDDPLTISISVVEDVIVVQNNLQPKSVTMEESTGVGLDNIVKRYAFLTDRPVVITHDDKFTVKLPLLSADPL
jgi:sensor histidine kinase YesM